MTTGDVMIHHGAVTTLRDQVAETIAREIIAYRRTADPELWRHMEKEEIEGEFEAARGGEARCAAEAVLQSFHDAAEQARTDALMEACSLADDMSDSLGNLHRLDYLSAVDYLIHRAREEVK